jgi:hypothetical protein
MAKPLMFFGVNLDKVNWYLVFYFLFAIIFLVGTTMKLFEMGPTRAVIYCVGALLVLIFYGYRWFGKGASAPLGKWPPTINTCPDYLTYVPSLPGDDVQGCVDMLGVSTNGSFKRTLPSEIIDGGNLASTQINQVIPFTSEDVTPGDTNTIQTICNRCQRMGLTWEGVYDGDVCVGISKSKIAEQEEAPQQCV